MATSKPYKVSDSEIKLPASVLFDEQGNANDVKKLKDAGNIGKTLEALWKNISENKTPSLVEHTQLGKMIVDGINNAGDRFFPSLEETKFPISRVKYYVALLLKENLEQDQEDRYKKALTKKEYIEILEAHLDDRVLNLTDKSIRNLKNPVPYKLRLMKTLSDKDFENVLSGDDAPYDKIDKKKQDSDELKRAINDFSKKHEMDLKEIGHYLQEVKDTPLQYVEKILEIEALKQELKRTRRTSIDLMKQQLVKEPELAELHDDRVSPKPFFFPSQQVATEKAKARKTAVVSV